MDLSVPLRSVAPSLDADALTVLARTHSPLTGRRVAQLAHRGSQPGIQKVLDRLVAHGLVNAQAAGSAVLYELNWDHLLARPLLEMVRARDDLISRMRAAIESWEQPCQHASLFGSLVRGEATALSDIDVLVVRPSEVPADDQTWQRQLDDLEADVRRWTGNPLAWFETTIADIARASDEGVVASWREDAMHLSGWRLSQVLEAAQA